MEQNRTKTLLGGFVYLAIFVLVVAGVHAEYPATVVDLGTAGDFAVLSKVAITSASASADIKGDIGVSPTSGTSITVACSELTGTIWQVDAGLVVPCAVDGAADSNAGKTYVDDAVLDLGAAYSAATGGANTPASGAEFLNLGAGTLTTRTLTPGVYTWDATLDITGDITLSCAGNSSEVFVFQVGTDLDLATTRQIILAGGCQASRVFWAVGGTTVLHEESHLEGTLIAGPGTTEITMIASTPGATVNGRLLGEKTIALQANSAITMPSNTAPGTSSVTSTPAETASMINWTTNVLSDSTVRYGIDSANLSDSESSSGSVMDHAVLLSGLMPSTLYHFEVISCDALGSCSTDGTHNFMTFSVGETIGDSSDIITTLPNVAAKINGTDAIDGTNFSGTHQVNITSDALAVVDFDYDFDASSLNFSEVSISNGTRSSASYMVVNGVDAAGTKTVYLHNASASFNGLCVQDAEGASVPSMNCNATNEFSLVCDGGVTNGVACTRTAGNTTLMVSGLQHSGVIQFAVSSNPAVDLGLAGDFVVLAKTGISTTGTTSIDGSIGVSPTAATSITGFGALPLDPSGMFSTSSLVNGNVYAADYAAPTPSMLTAAIGDMQTAYTTANGLAPDVTELGAGNIGGLTLTPGVYSWGTGLIIPTDVTLSGGSTDVWVFQIAQTLDLSNDKQVILSGGALAENVFWVVAGQTTLGTGSTFNGNVLDQTGIVMNTGSVFNGRALAQTAVTLDSSTVTVPSDTTAPTLSDVSSSSVTHDGASITWSTDQMADSTVEYGTTTGFGDLESSDSLITSHSMELSSLDADTRYYFSVTSCDPAGNCVTGSTDSFRTSKAPSSGGGGGGSARWECSEWSACASSGTQTRTCTNEGTGQGTFGKPTETQSCTPEATTPVPTPVTPRTTVTVSPEEIDGADTSVVDDEAPAPAKSPISGLAVGQEWQKPSWWVAALAVLAVIGLAIGGYFVLRK